MNLVLDVRTLRRMSRLKQRDLAEKAGISLNQLMKVERGLGRLDGPAFQNLCEALGVDPSNPGAWSGLLTEHVCGEGYVTARPLSTTTVQRRVAPSPALHPVIDLFCGVGGFSFGFETTGRFQVVAGIDILEDRLGTFAANHATANAYGQDIRSLAKTTLESENPRPFVIVGGPPCQGFSSLRPFRNIEWNDPRNNLVEEFCRIVADLRPEWVVFENVVGLLTHEGGRIFRAIVGAFESVGYRTSARVLNCSNFGIPQRRERLIIVGSLKGKPFKWPTPTHRDAYRSMAGDTDLLLKPDVSLSAPDLPDALTIDEAIHDLPPIEAGQTASLYRSDVKQTPFEKLMRNGTDVLTMHKATAHSAKMLEIIRHAGANINDLPEGMVTSGFSSCYSRLSGDEPSVTLTVNFVHPASNRCIHPTQHRALTPREGARLQSFLDTFEFKGGRSQIVKQIGNAVPPLLGSAIANAILESD